MLLNITQTPDSFWAPPKLPQPFVGLSPHLSRAMERAGVFLPVVDVLGRIETIAAVGAFYFQGLGFSSNDETYLVSAACAARAAGFGIAPSLRIAPINLVGGWDVLSPAAPRVQADMFVCCHLFDPKPGPTDGDLLATHPARRISPYHHMKKAWHNAADKMGAKIIVVFSLADAGDDLRAERFVGESFSIKDTSDFPATICGEHEVVLQREVLLRTSLPVKEKVLSNG